MKRLYETKISDIRWYFYDVPGNVGWIAYIVCLILGFVGRGENRAINIVGIVPAVFMLVGIAELVAERIENLDRILPLSRLLRGFGALTLGGLLGSVVGLVAAVLDFNAVYLIMAIGGALCFVFGGLLLIGYKRKKEDL
ncbi:MAG: hypothetical protein IJ735_01475 [Clostridia bacterium]|nr:hypothetical protein [Clostridia bacterium]